MKNLIQFFYEVGALRHVQRSHNMHMLQKTESVAEHSQRVTLIAYILAKKTKADQYKVILMAAFHDLPESRTGDANWHQKEYVSQDEEKAWNAQLKLIGKGSSEIKKLIKEYRERKTLESQLAKDADNIDYVLTLKELALTGNVEAKRRLKEDIRLSHLYTSIGKKVIKAVIKSRPNEWYQGDRKKTHKKYVVKPTK